MNSARQAGLGALVRAMTGAMQWRLLLLWAMVMLVPTAVAAWPMWKAMGALLDHSVHVSAWAERFHALPMTDLGTQLMRQGAGLGGAVGVGLLLSLLLSPWLTGMVVHAARAQRPPTFGELLHGGLLEYGRLLRLWLWALVPLGIAVAIGMIAQSAAGEYADRVILESDADRAAMIARGVALLLFVIAHAMVESARAAFVDDVGLRSATRALGRGIVLVLRRPLRTLGFYIVVTLVGLVLVTLLATLRTRVGGPGAGDMLLAFAVTQVGVMVIAWMRAARLFSLAAVARAAPTRRRGASRLAVA
jgi:hypothetical protein